MTIFSACLWVVLFCTCPVWAADPIVPNPEKTPGDVLTTNRQTVCVRGYATRARHVPVYRKRQVYQRYGLPTYLPTVYEMDHLISLQLGGSNTIRNLWPESYMTTPNAHDKDKLEQRLHSLVCKGKISLLEAQRQIAMDWLTAYMTYVGPLP